MKFADLVAIVAEEPVFETGLLLAGPSDAAAARRQLSRWTRTGKVVKLRRGLYALAPPWRRRVPHPFIVANRIVPGSYVTGLAALAYAHAIPEFVPETTSATSGRPQVRRIPLGRFSYRHVREGMHFGYRQLALGDGSEAFVATPEKALLDVVHWHPGGDGSAYLRELRLDYDVLDLDRLSEYAHRSDAPKLRRAADRVRELAANTPPYRVL